MHGRYLLGRPFVWFRRGTCAHSGVGGGQNVGNSLGTKAKKSSVSFSVGQFGKKPRAAYNSEQQMNMKGKPSGRANDLT